MMVTLVTVSLFFLSPLTLSFSLSPTLSVGTSGRQEKVGFSPPLPLSLSHFVRFSFFSILSDFCFFISVSDFRFRFSYFRFLFFGSGFRISDFPFSFLRFSFFHFCFSVFHFSISIFHFRFFISQFLGFSFLDFISRFSKTRRRGKLGC